MGTNEQLLTKILNLLRRLDDASVVSGVSGKMMSNIFLETRKYPQDQGLRINGNREGLIRFARCILEISQKNFPGAHWHFDEIGELDICEMPLVVCFRPAAWDAQPTRQCKEVIWMDDKQLKAIEERCNAATPGPWISYVEGRDHTSGSDFIMTDSEGVRGEDIELTGATIEDQDFIAHARQDIPQLLEEVRRLKSLLCLHPAQTPNK